MNFFKQTFVIILLVLISGCNSKSKNHEEKPKPDQQLKLSVKKEIDQFDEKENDKFLLTDNNVINFLFDYEKNNKENLDPIKVILRLKGNEDLNHDSWRVQ